MVVGDSNPRRGAINPDPLGSVPHREAGAGEEVGGVAAEPDPAPMSSWKFGVIRVAVAFPPNRTSRELEQLALQGFVLGRGKHAQGQSPDKVKRAEALPSSGQRTGGNGRDNAPIPGH